MTCWINRFAKGIVQDPVERMKTTINSLHISSQHLEEDEKNFEKLSSWVRPFDSLYECIYCKYNPPKIHH